MSDESLKIENIGFTVSSLIRRAPKWTMIRELTMNAIEAAKKAEGEKIVHWTKGELQGVRKAVIWNTGPGMDADQLKRATDLACKIDKELSVDGNFGVGAKVSSLASNKFGIRYRSCKDGVVHQVTIGEGDQPGNYVRFENYDENGESLGYVINVTEAVVKEKGRDWLKNDWTEVMLMGNSEDQDTVSQPFADDETPKGYIATALYRRFYRLPEGVYLRLDEEYHRYKGTRSLAALDQRDDEKFFGKVERVAIPEHGISIHFRHDPNIGDTSERKSSRNALASTTTLLAVVHKDEMFSCKTGPAWSAVAPKFGVFRGHRELSIIIELDDSKARPSQYRERLIDPEDSEDVGPEDYAVLVLEHMPDWMKEIIKNLDEGNKRDFSKSRYEELQKLLDSLRVKADGVKKTKSGGKSAIEGGSGQPAAGGRKENGLNPHPNPGPGKAPGKKRMRFAPEGATSASPYVMYEKAPEIEILTTEEAVKDRGIEGKAAAAFPQVGKLYVNGLYEAVDRMVEEILPGLISRIDQEDARSALTVVAREAVAFKVAKSVVFAMAKRSNDHWNEDDMNKALSPESLTLAADDYQDSTKDVKRAAERELNIKQL